MKKKGTIEYVEKNKVAFLVASISLLLILFYAIDINEHMPTTFEELNNLLSKLTYSGKPMLNMSLEPNTAMYYSQNIPIPTSCNLGEPIKCFLRDGGAMLYALSDLGTSCEDYITQNMGSQSTFIEKNNDVLIYDIASESFTFRTYVLCTGSENQFLIYSTNLDLINQYKNLIR